MAGRYAAVKTDDSQAMALLAWYSANLGEEEAARQWLAKAEALRTEEGEVALLAAQTLARLEDGDAARAGWCAPATCRCPSAGSRHRRCCGSWRAIPPSLPHRLPKDKSPVPHPAGIDRGGRHHEGHHDRVRLEPGRPFASPIRAT